MRPGHPGFNLLGLWVFCVISALFAPRLFAGATEVFSIARSANADGILSVPLRATTGNITQLFSMTLSVLAFFCFATVFRFRPNPRAVVIGLAAATLVHVVLGWLDVLSAAVGASTLLEPIRTANYAMLTDHRMLGIKRMVGGFPEASAFGSFSLGVFAFWLHLWVSERRSILARVMMALSLIALLRSTSSGAYVALVVFLAIYGGYLLITRLRPNIPRRSLVIFAFGMLSLWLAALAMFAAYQMVDPVTAFLDRSLFDKLDSQSGVERMSWNAQAFRNFTETAYMGAGLGSVRASNWFLACLGSLGLIGTVLYLSCLFYTSDAAEE